MQRHQVLQTYESSACGSEMKVIEASTVPPSQANKVLRLAKRKALPRPADAVQLETAVWAGFPDLQRAGKYAAMHCMLCIHWRQQHVIQPSSDST